MASLEHLENSLRIFITAYIVIEDLLNGLLILTRASSIGKMKSADAFANSDVRAALFLLFLRNISTALG